MYPSERLRLQAQTAERLAKQVSIISDREQLREQAKRLHAAAGLAEQAEARHRDPDVSSDESAE